ncbi:MAG: hypothetical protein CUN55_16285, partial [Phototrophicales bacterium]
THRNEQGFTLVELLLVVAIVAIFSMVAIPSYQSTVLNNRMTSTANQFLGALYFARSEAVKRSEEVRICTSNNTHLSLDSISCVNSAGWHDGWVMWVDSNSNGALDAVEIIKVGNEVDGDITFYPTADVKNSLTFSRRGLVGVSGTWKLCDKRGKDRAKAIVISPSGRAKISTVDHLGGALTCS